MQLGRSCCLSAICRQRSASQWLWPSAKTWCGPTARRLQVRRIHFCAVVCFTVCFIQIGRWNFNDLLIMLSILLWHISTATLLIMCKGLCFSLISLSWGNYCVPCKCVQGSDCLYMGNLGFRSLKLCGNLFHSFLSSDPFVKVYLLQDGRKISKKKTSTKRDDTNPIFNEAMIFSVPSIVLQVTLGTVA